MKEYSTHEKPIRFSLNTHCNESLPASTFPVTINLFCLLNDIKFFALKFTHLQEKALVLFAVGSLRDMSVRGKEFTGIKTGIFFHCKY